MAFLENRQLGFDDWIDERVGIEIGILARLGKSSTGIMSFVWNVIRLFITLSIIGFSCVILFLGEGSLSCILAHRWRLLFASLTGFAVGILSIMLEDSIRGLIAHPEKVMSTVRLDRCLNFLNVVYTISLLIIVLSAIIDRSITLFFAFLFIRFMGIDCGATLIMSRKGQFFTNILTYFFIFGWLTVLAFLRID